jgi:subtilisin-like proprotein convertase family protein
MKVSNRIGTTLAAFVLSVALAPAASAATFSNTAPIEIADEAPATPYPSAIAVSGLIGEVTDLNVTLNGLTHTHLDDLAVVVEGPGNEMLMLMNGVGPIVNPADPTSGVIDIDLTLDDQAGTQLAATTVPTTGGYRPANHSPGLDFFPGDPGTFYANPGPAAGGSATLASVFGNLDPTGGWKLFVHDFAQDDVGEIAGGWSLDVTTDGTDDTGPVTTITSGPAGTISQASASFGFSANESATFECKIDSGAFVSCTTPKAYAGLSEGTHTFSVRGTDAATYVGAAASRTFSVDLADAPPPPPPPPPPPSGGGGTIDMTPPLVSITGVKVKSKKRSAKVEFSGSDDVTAAGALGFTCKLDKLAATACNSPKTYKKLKPGKHRIEVAAIDAAGNSGVASKGFKVKKPS